MVDWVKALTGFSQSQIAGACDAYIRTEQWKPRPAQIIELIKSQRGKGQNRMAELTGQEAEIAAANMKTARRWMQTYPNGSALHEAGKQTIAYWEGQA